MNLIQHIIEPNRLLIVWQSPQDGTGSGKRYVIGELKLDQSNNVLLRYFKMSKDFQEALKHEFKGFSIFDTKEENHTQNVMEMLNRRIPSRQRTDFPDFLKYYRIAPEIGSQMTDFALLGYTGAKLPGDGFSFVHTFENALAPCEIAIEVAGARHYSKKFENLNELVDTPVVFTAEPDNQEDLNAITITLKDTCKKVGYINRAQTEIFHKWLENNNVNAHIERINGTPERPNILLYVKVT